MVTSMTLMENFFDTPQPFFEDELGLVNKKRPQRQRRQQVLFNASILGGATQATTKAC